MAKLKNGAIGRYLAGAAMLLIVLSSGGANAAWEPSPLALSPEDRELVGDIEVYLNGITTLEAGFIQITAGGGFSQGKFFLKRPGRMRFEYSPPVPYLLISDGKWFIYVDKELEQVTYLPVNKTPAGVLLRENFSFSDSLTIIGLKRAAGTVKVEIVDQSEPDMGRISLTFIRNPLSLKSWTVHDPQGQRIQVTLTDPLYGSQLDASLFRFVNTFDNRRRE